MVKRLVAALVGLAAVLLAFLLVVIGVSQPLDLLWPLVGAVFGFFALKPLRGLGFWPQFWVVITLPFVFSWIGDSDYESPILLGLWAGLNLVIGGSLLRWAFAPTKVSAKMAAGLKKYPFMSAPSKGVIVMSLIAILVIVAIVAVVQP